MEQVSILEASKRLGLTKQAILNRIKTNKLDAQKDENGIWKIEVNNKFTSKKQNKDKEFESFTSKASKKAAKLDTPTPIPENIQEEIKNLKQQTFELNQSIQEFKDQQSTNENWEKVHLKLKKQNYLSVASFFIVCVLSSIYIFKPKVAKLQNSNQEHIAHLSRSNPMLSKRSDYKNLTQNSLKEKVEAAISNGIAFLYSNQSNGHWPGQPGITALCSLGLIHSPNPDRKTLKLIESSLDYLISLQQNDGAIAFPDIAFSLKNYNTALSLIALKDSKIPNFESNIHKASQYLKELQIPSSNHGIQKYENGGIGYSIGSRADISNLSIALEALSEHIPKNSPIYKNALTYISLCQQSQNNPFNSNPATGGFSYSPNKNYNQNYLSYHQTKSTHGSITFSGINSLLFCHVQDHDTRLQETLKWLQNNFEVEQNPGMGQIAIYYYFYNVAKALEALGVQKIQHISGQNLDWKRELASELLFRQHQNGSWENTEIKYMENNPILATAYALNSLNIIYKSFL